MAGKQPFDIYVRSKIDDSALATITLYPGKFQNGDELIGGIHEIDL